MIPVPGDAGNNDDDDQEEEEEEDESDGDEEEDEHNQSPTVSIGEEVDVSQVAQVIAVGAEVEL